MVTVCDVAMETPKVSEIDPFLDGPFTMEKGDMRSAENTVKYRRFTIVLPLPAIKSLLRIGYFTVYRLRTRAHTIDNT